jgi:hypothetical protein
MVSSPNTKIADIGRYGSLMPLGEPTLNRRSGHLLKHLLQVRTPLSKLYAEVDRFRRLIFGRGEREEYPLKVGLHWDGDGLVKPPFGGLGAQAFKVVPGDVDLAQDCIAVVSPPPAVRQFRPARSHGPASFRARTRRTSMFMAALHGHEGAP